MWNAAGDEESSRREKNFGFGEILSLGVIRSPLIGRILYFSGFGIMFLQFCEFGLVENDISVSLGYVEKP